MPVIENLAQVVGENLEDMPEAVAVLNEFQAAANAYTARLDEIRANEDLSEKGKQRLAEKEKEIFDAAVGGVQASLDKAALLAQARVDKAKSDAHKVPELPPSAPVDAIFALEQVRNLAPEDFVTFYQTALEMGDYINRRACEAVANVVLKYSPERLTQFHSVMESANAPTPDQVEAQGKLGVLRKVEQVLTYSLDTLHKEGKLPFIGEHSS